MPGSFEPKGALGAEADLSALRGISWFTRTTPGVTQVIMRTTAPILVRDVIHLLNGYGSAQAIQTLLTANGTGAGVWTIGIDENDRVYIENSIADFSLLGGTGLEAFGFSPSGHAPIGGVAPFRRTAPNNWQRGNIESADIGILPSGSAFFYLMGGGDTAAYRAQDVITLFRGRGAVGDLDDLLVDECLEARDQADATTASRWGVDATGRVWCAWPDSPVRGAPVWVDDTVRRLLGFTGNETAVTTNRLTVLTATNRTPLLMTLTRPFKTFDPGLIHTVGGSMTPGGRVGALYQGRASVWDLEAYWSGTATELDDERHLFCPGGFLDRAPPGYPVTVWPEWGDPRRGSSDPNQAYDLLYTPEEQGRRGRRVCKRDPQDPSDLMASYSTDLRSRGELKVKLVEDLDA